MCYEEEPKRGGGGTVGRGKSLVLKFLLARRSV